MTDSSTPLYVQIKHYLLMNIQSGAFAPDTRIPSERQLSAQFGVSRLTVNKAIKTLMQEGLLYAQVGKGTYVSSTKIHQELHTLTSFTEEMNRRGQHPSSYVLHAAVEPASGETAKVLNILSGAEVVVLKRVRLADGQPIALETSSVIAAICPGILDSHDFASQSLYEVLRNEYNLQLIRAEQTFEARQATRVEADALGLEICAPILNIIRVTYSGDRRPIEYVRSAYRGDRYKFRAVLRLTE